ncbi:MAG: DNA-processing protein DprA [Candidatus Campbellbacteria bacterium]|nr:DNA-processing protein DprA [Candidatus Campbellbacteria bacterium]
MNTFNDSQMHTLLPNEFPALLNEIPDPPKKLYIEGSPIKESGVRIAVVGSRKYSEYGKRATESIISGLANYNVTIVSGCALGIDSIAHQAALRHNINTIGIPGSGLDKSVFYPRSNFFLRDKILEAKGSLLSEFEPNQKAERWTFPKRNRIMAGISHAILVIEAAEKSGTLITARLGLEYDREVMAVPGSIFSETSAGTNDLIRDGARPILSAQDIIEELSLEEKEDLEKETDNANEYGDILSNFSEKISRDEFIANVGNTEEALIILTKMELKGIIRIQGDTIYKN